MSHPLTVRKRQESRTRSLQKEFLAPRSQGYRRPDAVNRSASHQRRLSCQSRGSPRTSSCSRGNARAQALQLAVPEPDWVVVVRLDVIGDAGGDDFAFC